MVPTNMACVKKMVKKFAWDVQHQQFCKVRWPFGQKDEHDWLPRTTVTPMDKKQRSKPNPTQTTRSKNTRSVGEICPEVVKVRISRPATHMLLQSLLQSPQLLLTVAQSVLHLLHQLLFAHLAHFLTGLAHLLDVAGLQHSVNQSDPQVTQLVKHASESVRPATDHVSAPPTPLLTVCVKPTTVTVSLVCNSYCTSQACKSLCQSGLQQLLYQSGL